MLVRPLPAFGAGAALASGLLLAAPSAMVAGDLDDVIRVGGITYVSQESGEHARWPERVSQSLLGETIAVVTCVLRQRQTCPADGVAASVLPAGTPIHAVNGYRGAFRLAAWRDGEVVLYEAWENPRARRGFDLYDLAGKVAAVEILREDRTTTAALHKSFARPDGARIEDPGAIGKLVDLILAAPTVPPGDRRPGNPRLRYWLTFRFRDGTATGRAYDPESGQLARGLVLPPEFRTLVEDAVNLAAPRSP